MNRVILCSSILLLLSSIACTQPATTKGSETGSETADTLISTSEIPMEIEQCNMDSLTFSEKMGVGIMSLRIRPEDSILMIEEGSKDTLFLMLSEGRSGWAIRGSKDGKEVLIAPFKEATNFENFGFLWMGNKPRSLWSRVYLTKDRTTYLFENGPGTETKFSLIRWKNYLNSSILVRSELALFDKPNGNLIGTVQGGYKVLDLKDQWIKVSYLDPTDPSQSDFPPVGWIQWFCSDGMQIFIADDTWMEDYYHGYGGWMEDQP